MSKTLKDNPKMKTDFSRTIMCIKITHIYMNYVYYGLLNNIWLLTVALRKPLLYFHHHLKVSNQGWVQKTPTLPAWLLGDIPAPEARA